MQDERYKVKYGAIQERLGTQNVLLPLSFGPSSLVLFDMIASLLLEQNLAHKGKQGFELEVIHLKEPKFMFDGPLSKEEETDDSKKSSVERFSELSQRYSPVKIAYHEIDLNTYAMDPMMAMTVSSSFEVSAAVPPSHSLQCIGDLLEACPTRSLQEDLLNVLKDEIIKRTAVELGIQTIVYGHSLTRIANEVISLTVKGRGLTIHESVINKTIQYNDTDLQLIFPLREILKAEIAAIILFDQVLQSAVQPDARPGSRLAKNMTVRDLTTQYFDNLDATGYVSTSSTVVKTAEKLGGPRELKLGQCEVCGSGIHHYPQKWLSDITVNTAAPLTTSEEEEYAQRYTDPDLNSSGRKMQVCYGCTVTLAGSGREFVWPTRATKSEIIDEFVLTDDEGEGDEQ